MAINHARNLLAPLEARLWYALLTVCGEIEEEVSLLLDPTKEQKVILDGNRRIWNGFVCHDMDKNKRNELAGLIGLDPEDLRKWDKHEEKQIENALRKRFSNNAHVRNYLSTGRRIIDFFDKDEYIRIENFHIKKPLHAFHFVFPKISFVGSKFAKTCFFVNSIFEDSVFFDKAHFQSEICFRNTFFNMRGEGKISSFQGVTFDKISDFEGTSFKGLHIFTDSNFNAHSVFNMAKFEHYVPQFYGINLKQSIQFTYDKENWPRPDHDGSTGKESYTCLRRIMLNQRKPDEEHFFYRQEMAWKAHHEKSHWINWAAINLYGRLSDYGYSLWKPLRWFLVFFLLPTLSILFDPSGSFIGDLEKIGYVLHISATNMFPLFEFGKQVHQSLLPLGKCTLLWFTISVAQYLASVVFLFLFALALRNRFRLR